ncbi:hypothetical protein AAHE18_11G118600 [Arachis hypogaea]
MRKKKQQSVAEADALIELIPAKLFLLTDDKDKPWFQGLSKAKKAENLGKEKANESSDEEDGEAKPIALEGDNRSMTYEELRQKLHRKLEEFHSSCENSGRAKKREDRNAKRRFEDRKRKKKVKKDAAETSNELVFGHIKLTDGEMQGKKKRKLSNHKELERAKKLEEVKNNPEKGEAVAKKQMWKAALDRASGIKVHDDDPKLLEKSIRKEKKKQQKNAEKWKEGIQTRDQLKAKKQQKRSDNISERIHQKKMHKIAKREKKLLRPGFEGHKEGFITEGSS